MCLPDYATLPGSRTPWDAFVSLAKEVWGEDFDEDINAVSFEEYQIGLVDDYQEVMRDVTLFSKPSQIPESWLANLKIKLEP